MGCPAPEPWNQDKIATGKPLTSKGSQSKQIVHPVNIQPKHCNQGNGAELIIGTTSDGVYYSIALHLNRNKQHFYPVHDVHHKIL